MSATDIIVYLPLLVLPLLLSFVVSSAVKNGRNPSGHLRTYPLIGMLISTYVSKNKPHEWITELLRSTPSQTFTFRHLCFFPPHVITANPANVQHILKDNFSTYEKGSDFRDALYDLIGRSIFNVDGDDWKVQRQVATHEFSTKSLRKFMETIVEAELQNRWHPMLTSAAALKSVVDLQDVLQRFGFDNICQFAFGYDPAYLSPGVPEAEFAKAFERAVFLISKRCSSIFPTWKVKKFLQLGSEKELRNDVACVRDLARKILKEKKEKLASSPATDSGEDLVSRFLKSGLSEENLVADIVIGFILAGRDSTSAALTWFFWLIHKNPRVENEILKDINNHSGSSAFEDMKKLTYTHAALCETMRLYPPVPAERKQAVHDDVLPDGTQVRKGMMVWYIPYAMGRMEKLWGSDWEEFKPERWLQKDSEGTGKAKLISMDWYKYPVFQAGPRICLGKEMAFLQMKRVVVGILKEFKVAPASQGFDAVMEGYLVTKMRGGFPVRFEKRKLD